MDGELRFGRSLEGTTSAKWDASAEHDRGPSVEQKAAARCYGLAGNRGATERKAVDTEDGCGTSQIEES